MKEKRSISDKIEDWFEKSPLVACITTMTLIVSVIGFGIIMSVILCFVFHNAWPLLIYIPEIGVIAGIAFYMEEYS